MPANSSGRMYFYLGSPNSKYFDFIEFTVGSDSMNVDTTRVDRFGLKLALLAHSHSGQTQEVGEDYATFKESRAATFARFEAFVPSQFKGLATIDAPYGIPSPGNDPAFQPGGKYASYFTAYADAHGAKATPPPTSSAAAARCPPTPRCAPPSTATSPSCRRPSSRTRPTSTRPARPTTTPSSGTRTPSTASSTASPTTTTRASPRTSPSPTPQYMIVAVGW